MIYSYELAAEKLKAFSDSNRLKIIDMLSCGELCACKILEAFKFTQPTLSHHMKILCDSEIVLSRKEGKNNYYQLNHAEIETLHTFLRTTTNQKENCICHTQYKGDNDE
ncbi:MAG: ArsR/SmtB family transcription factor [Anaerorhabdus sp.]